MAFTYARDRRHDLARGAIAALQGVMIQKRLLDGMQAAVLPRDAFDRGDFLVLGLFGEHQAGKYSAAINMDSAGPALAVIAPLLGAEQAESLPQRVEQTHARIELQLVG